MADVITSGATVITPTLILGYESTRAPGTIVHDIIGRANPDVTLRPAGTRTGRMELGFIGEADSYAAETALSTAAVFTLTSTDRPTVALSFIVKEGGTITRTLDDETRNAWTVAFDWREVTA